MRVVKALDAGPMLARRTAPIGPDETSDEVERDLARLGARAARRRRRSASPDGSAHETPQDEALATYAHRLTKEDGVIDWSWPARRIHNLIRGLHPWPHAFSFVRRQAADPALASHASPDADRAYAAAAPGTIVDADGDRLIVATGDGVLRHRSRSRPRASGR